MKRDKVLFFTIFDIFCVFCSQTNGDDLHTIFSFFIFLVFKLPFYQICHNSLYKTRQNNLFITKNENEEIQKTKQNQHNRNAEDSPLIHLHTIKAFCHAKHITTLNPAKKKRTTKQEKLFFQHSIFQTVKL